IVPRTLIRVNTFFKKFWNLFFFRRSTPCAATVLSYKLFFNFFINYLRGYQISWFEVHGGLLHPRILILS
ncbi:MAG: hypothetical protein AAGM40_10855, partial [Cyanobacteria bacterium J06573_2]